MVAVYGYPGLHPTYGSSCVRLAYHPGNGPDGAPREASVVVVEPCPFNPTTKDETYATGKSIINTPFLSATRMSKVSVLHRQTSDAFPRTYAMITVSGMEVSSPSPNTTGTDKLMP